MSQEEEPLHDRNWRRFRELMRLANQAGRRQCLEENPWATEEEIQAYLERWWAKRKNEELPPGWTAREPRSSIREPTSASSCGSRS